MKLYRVWALIERDMRKFFRSPALMITSMIFPLMQLIVLGYAFGGKIHGVRVAIVDEDRGAQAVKVRELLEGIASGPKTIRLVDYRSLPRAVEDLKVGFVRGVVHIPYDYSERVYHNDRPRLVFIEDNTDQFMSSALFERVQQAVEQMNAPTVISRLPSQVDLNVVEVYPYIEYIKYLLPGSIAMAIFVVSMIGGGITFIDDKARGVHEGYLVTPLKRTELVLGFNLSGAIKGVMAGVVITVIGGMIAGIEGLWNPLRLLYLTLVVAIASLTMISLMFVIMVRTDDPLVPRAIFGVLNTLLFFPSGAIFPIEGFPRWLQWIAVVDPFTYTVHALRSLLLKSASLTGIYLDILILLGLSVGLLGTGIALFKRQL
jgi:ABC-type multidrug transport system permease subunit